MAEMEQLQAASRRAAMRLRLLRARELCLLGEYDAGVPEFKAVLLDVKHQCAFAAPEVRQFLQELQSEYAMIVQYQKSLQELRASAMKLPEKRRRRDERRSSAWSMEPPAAKTVITQRRSTRVKVVEDSAEPMDVDQQGPMASKIALEKRLPVWARKKESTRVNQATTSSRSVTTRRGVAAARGGTVKDKENQPKNSVARYGTSYKSTAEMALQTWRRQRVSIGGGGKKVENTDEPIKSAPSGDPELIAGRKKYSDIAKESGWADQELIKSIEREIVDRGEPTRFDDIAGLEHTKQLLQEAVMLPQIAPHLFKDGLLKHCSGILMFGPPGTGKTLLAKAVANECGLTFFNVSASTLSSKYRGDSEKLVRILFEMARYYAPSIIFMDEIDAIASARGGANEHEASRRVKTELLVQINGVPSGGAVEQENAHVMLLAATNLPWELDEAMRRRLTKRVYIPLPEDDARRALFHLNLRKVQLSDDVNVEELVAKTRGYSGDDITNVCETAKRMPVKRLYTPDLLSQLSRRMMEGGGRVDLEDQELIVTRSDFMEALCNVSKSVSREQLTRFAAWEKEFGSK